MGLEAPDPDLLAASSGGVVVTPSGMVLDGTKDDIQAPPAASETDDPDGDGVVNEIPTSIVDYMEFYLLNYFKPALYEQTSDVTKGKKLLQDIGCTQCHIPDLLINHDRRVADVDTTFAASDPGFNRFFATAAERFHEQNDRSGLPTLKRPNGESLLVRNIFTDFKRHDLGPNFHEVNFNGSVTKEFITEQLWGVGSTAPYGHDGRSINLTEVILRHSGEAQASRDAFVSLSEVNKGRVLTFLNSLVLFPPDDTSSNLNPGNPLTPGFPQFGHGSIKLGALFNDPTDPE
ncbi:MAG: hypothetical protein HY287_08840 [Planctomycetes bacterium]|nr:hypothetical protein [Planctomycetota bacterium]MBI3834419.1 hypothetical protein [Planctomycetota bacterium]